MVIYVDADACPVVKEIERLGKKYKITVFLFCDMNHELKSNYCKIIVVESGTDAVDFALFGRIKKGDIVVTQDYGVAAMALSKGAFGIHQNGSWYSEKNIDQMLMERHLAKKARRASKKHHGKGPRKRKEQDNKRFEIALEKLILEIKTTEHI